jgi:hypothetical protein
MLVVKGSDGLLKSPFADVTPRADQIRNHVNGEIHRNSILTNRAILFQR